MWPTRLKHPVYLGAATLLIASVLFVATRPAPNRPKPPVVVVANIHLTPLAGFRLQAEGMNVTYAFEISNSASDAVEIRYPVSHLPPGIVLRDSVSDTVVIAAHGSIGVVIGLEVKSCAEIPGQTWVLRLSARPVGDQSWVDTDLIPPSTSAVDGWQAQVKRAVCVPPASP